MLIKTRKLLEIKLSQWVDATIGYMKQNVCFGASEENTHHQEVLQNREYMRVVVVCLYVF